MLMDSLSKSIKNMKQMDIVENAALDAEKRLRTILTIGRLWKIFQRSWINCNRL